MGENVLTDISDAVFETIKHADGTVTKSDLVEQLESRGILRDDPRISDLQSYLEKCPKVLDKEKVRKCMKRNRSTTQAALSNSLIIEDFESFSTDIKDIFDSVKGNKEGKLADYIPQLQKQNPDHFGLSICSIDGQRLHIGDSDISFSIQSCAKPIMYCLALEEHGAEVVHKHVGREPSGSVFNALKLNKKGLPHNPLVNSGAIMVCSLIQRTLKADDRFDYITDMWKQLTGCEPLGYSNATYLSERSCCDRNFALAHFMQEKKTFPPKVDIVDVLEFYFQCCSLTITTDALSIVAATLANGGVNPLTGDQVLSAESVKNCLSVMYSCGMYDYSGEFAFKVGLPAKSGASGAIMVVIPNVMGIATFSPPLNTYGNSVRGGDFFIKLVEKFNFHLFDNIKITKEIKEDPRNEQPSGTETSLESVVESAAAGDMKALLRLKLKGENLFKPNCDNRTSLHVAAANNNLEVVKFLLNSDDADVNVKDRWKGTAYDDAVREGHKDVAEFLKLKGGLPGGRE